VFGEESLDGPRQKPDRPRRHPHQRDHGQQECRLGLAVQIFGALLLLGVAARRAAPSMSAFLAYPELQLQHHAGA
jgi:hypothetical protein